jgi:hypothetical protein
VHRQVRFGQQHDARHALAALAEAMEQLAHRCQARTDHGRHAERPQRRRVGHHGQRGIAAAQVGGEVQAVHQCAGAVSDGGWGLCIGGLSSR